MNTLSNDFLTANGIRRLILNMFGAATACNAPWDLNKFVDYIKSDPDVKKLNINNMSDTELINLGFGVIDKDNNIRLIPSWIYQFLPETIYVYGRDSKEPMAMKKEQLGEPNTGYFGFGILGKDMKLTNEEKLIETIKDNNEQNN